MMYHQHYIHAISPIQLRDAQADEFGRLWQQAHCFFSRVNIQIPKPEAGKPWVFLFVVTAVASLNPKHSFWL